VEISPFHSFHHNRTNRQLVELEEHSKMCLSTTVSLFLLHWKPKTYQNEVTKQRYSGYNVTKTKMAQSQPS